MTRLLQAFSMVVTDRRWTAPMAATALGFGIFAGVAIGPSASGTLAGAPQVIEVMEPTEDAPEPVEEAPESFAEAGGGGFEEEAPPAAFPAAAPLAPEPAPAEPAEPAPAPEPLPPEEPAQPEGTELKGTVVHANPAAGSYALAVKGGEPVPVHARELPKAGAELTAIARRLANGTFAEEESPKRTGKAAEATFVGTVTWVAPGDVPGLEHPYGPQSDGTSAYTVSGRGASLLVRVDPDPSGAPPRLPQIGAYVKVTAAIEEEALRQRELAIEPGEPSTYLDLAGIAGTFAPETSQLLFSADGMRASEADLTLVVPPGIDPERVRPGDSYLATAEVQPDGSLLLKGIASDEHYRGADDASSAQGDLKRPSRGQP